MIRTFMLAIVAAAAITASATAQDQTARFYPDPMPDAAVDQLLTVVTQNIGSAVGEDGQPLPPLSEAQLSQPLLDRETAREIADLGIASGVGQACGLNWQSRNFVPMMARERARGDRTQHQLAAIALLHGFMQSMVTNQGSCGVTGATAAAAFYDRKWGPQ